ncbi:hypothetical protein [Roseibium aggregatum]|uniref:Uncharacterized protein n=1 Tax=Roseibium aggregatum TaxID=187304 RepID=A0A939EEE6_9HYPH|nr:hypothetical protein [Roseibium aggregatum]MBN9671017.1 hypothetical protein [Roseibium aggregatum]
MPAIRPKTASLLLGLSLAVTSGIQTVHAQDGFREIRVAPGMATSRSFIEVLKPFLDGHPESTEGNAGMELSVNKDKAGSGFRVEIVKTGYLDDSVLGEHFRGYVIQTSKGEWELLSMAVKQLCARGETSEGTCQ